MRTLKSNEHCSLHNPVLHFNNGLYYSKGKSDYG